MRTTEKEERIPERADRSDTGGLRFSIWDPTGNITILVESRVEIPDQPETAAGLMKKYPEAEQTGFVTWEASDGGPSLPALRMAGGEFCGNASMSAAALFRRKGVGGDSSEDPVTVRLKVSGASRPVDVLLWRENDSFDSFRAEVNMPPALSVGKREFAFEEKRGLLPVVRLEGISHIIVEQESAFSGLKECREEAETAVREWCGELEADGLGLMFLEGTGPEMNLTPLVYIPGSGTVFWENSCASGSAAAGRYLAEKRGVPVCLTFCEPGGELRVRSDPVSGETFLGGHVRRIDR